MQESIQLLHFRHHLRCLVGEVTLFQVFGKVPGLENFTYKTTRKPQASGAWNFVDQGAFDQLQATSIWEAQTNKTKTETKMPNQNKHVTRNLAC